MNLQQQRYNTQEEDQVENTAVRKLGIRQTIDNRAILSSRPRTLYVLWQEYKFGIGGKKAAKLFNASERGRNKFAFSLRKPFWDLVVCMIFHGYNHNTAIDKIYEAYGNKPVVKIIRQIRSDKRTGRHNALWKFVSVAQV
jgi:hypothetical protein